MRDSMADGNTAAGKRILVIGGANADIHGAPAGSVLIPRDSNPGRITVSPGGVGRNIAVDLALLGLRVSMLTAFGDDSFAPVIRNSLTARGIDVSLSLTVPGSSSSLYLYISDGQGDMAVAVSDMDVVNSITPAYLETHMKEINSFDAVVADANLSTGALEFLCTHCAVPLTVDPVSVTKAEKLKGLLSCISCIKPNLLEAQHLTGRTTPEDCVRALFKAGVRRPFVSCGTDGIVTCDGAVSSILRIPARKVSAVDATGAGDAATAALVYAGLNGLSAGKAAELAAGAGAAAVGTAGATLPEDFLERILRSIAS